MQKLKAEISISAFFFINIKLTSAIISMI